MRMSSLPLRWIAEHPENPVDRNAWFAQVPAVRQLLETGLEFGPLTVFVGENGAGKSTIVEAIAAAYGLNPEGGTHNARYSTFASESPLESHLQIARGAGVARKGVFLRAETMHSHFGYLYKIESEDNGPLGRHNYQSHGESFLEYLGARDGIRGLWVFDEPESALSFTNSLGLLAQMLELARAGSQVILSTHSPVLASLPGADVYELGEWGMRRTRYDDLQIVDSWRRFLAEPQRYLRHLE
ncbi:putative ATPase [Leucobacter komagatae]|uniref:Putative ATPase n=2 Tax=Leucobacter komagatae TaxID=55969 RepID=A0A542Y706_9MICO|nr:AAA family ATPase [Leucobacter komagatae]TQL43880.1 putative ATPase [Leucobacter komagatae]